MSVRQTVAIAQIKVGARIRQALPDRVKALAISIAENGQDKPIDIVQCKDGFELIAGGHRLAAVLELNHETIEADVYSEAEFNSTHKKRLREIRENLERFELNALEKAVSVAGYKESFEALNGAAKRGRKKATEIDPEEMSAKFALNFNEAAQKIFGLSRRSVFLSLKIASIDAKVRDRIANHSIANNQSDLLALAEETAELQSKVCDLLLSEPPSAKSAIEAISSFSNTPKPRSLTAWEVASGRFSKLTPKDQNKFFELHAEAIEKWFASRGK